MRLLLCLADHAGKVVSIDDLLNHVWSEVTVTPDSVYQAVASLRRVLGDDPRQPTYIATVPRLGYRMLATVGPWTDQTTPQTGSSAPSDGEGRIAGDDRRVDTGAAPQRQPSMGRACGRARRRVGFFSRWLATA